MPKANERIGPYQLINKLGKGAFGEVWLAKNVTALAAREVALKIPLDDEIDLEAIRAEAAIWIKASGHANVLPIIEANVYDDYVVIASEYAPDGSLEQWLKNHGGRAPSVEAAIEMMRGILDGLGHLHSRQIIHRDLKPANILLQGSTPRLTDFGISRVLKSTSRSATVSGTPVYMAPEAFDARRNQQTDLWSASVILYEMLTGQLPFIGQDWAELYGAIRGREPEPLPDETPGWLRELMAKALKKNPAERFQSASEMQAALTQPRHEAKQPVETQAAASKPQTNIELSSTEREVIAQTAPDPAKNKPAQEIDPYLTRVTDLLAPDSTESLKSELPSEKAKLQPQSAPLKNLRLAVKWGASMAVAFIALATYLATITSSPTPPSFSPAPGGTDTRTDLVENLNGVRLEMMRVPGGEFLMGSPENEPDRSENEGPQHRVTVPSLYIGKYEVTQAQWEAVMGSNNNRSSYKGNDLPVHNVAWVDAKDFCQKLSDMTGKTYRLPSEAEWEYACRAGATGAYAGDLDSMAWYYNTAGHKPHPVGQKQPNSFGLYDMHGNVSEWCEDFWHDNYNGAPTDGLAWLSSGDSSRHVERGCAWDFGNSSILRSAKRFGFDPHYRHFSSGIRVVVSASTP
jgi:formylglycine-generating enzyme required for sulfatase activity/tRNA A-37 threonylcarbamoyl transferase component Bud32